MQERIRRVIFSCCAIGVGICLLCLGVTLFLQIKDNRVQQELLAILTETDTVQSQADHPEEEIDTDIAVQDSYLENLAALYAENTDFIGWISIADAEVNYPVMYTPGDAEYYLHKDFYGNYSFAGTVFASADCSFSPRSDNIILYGHNMANGSMFADLLNYQSQDYWQSHQTIQFDTLSGAQTYQIMYAFTQDISADNPHFAFYQFINADDVDAFDAFIASCESSSLYDTDESATYGDQLLTLVTCKGSDTTERMVVIAKAVDAECD